MKAECQALDCEEVRWGNSPYCSRHMLLYIWWEMEEIESITLKSWFMVL